MSSKRNSNRPKSRGARIVSNTSIQKIVGSYILGKTVGEGTFGKVKIAVHIPTGEKVAVKILEKSKIKDQADVRRVNREIKILKKTRHSNIIQLYEVIDTSNAIYLMMENADGGEMFDYIVEHRHVSELQACKFFHQIVDGTEVLHKNEITHRDLKPENLLLKNSPDGWIVKIVDFGLSNTHEGGKYLTTACGSPCYAAPEMIAGHSYFGPIADMWSIGVILFALVCGYLPFEDPNTAQLYKKILSGEYKTARWISHDVKDLLSKILDVDPKKRYTAAQIRIHPWYRMVDDSAIPKDQVHESSFSEIFKPETLAAVDKAGFDAQAVSDAVSSNACNSLSALYYLFEQKLVAERLNKPEVNSDSAIVTHRNNVSVTTAASIPVDPVAESLQIPALRTKIPAINVSNGPPMQHNQNQRPVNGSSPYHLAQVVVPAAKLIDPHSVGASESSSSPRPPLGQGKQAGPVVLLDRQNWRGRIVKAVDGQIDASRGDPLGPISVKAVLQPNSPRSTSPRSHQPASPPKQAKSDTDKSDPQRKIETLEIVVSDQKSEQDPQSTKINMSFVKDAENVPAEAPNPDVMVIASPPPDVVGAAPIERPLTRRSHLRTPGGRTRPNTAEYGEFGALQLSDQVQAAHLSSVGNDLNLSNVPPAQLVEAPEGEPLIAPRAPDGPKSSNINGSSRHAKHLHTNFDKAVVPAAENADRNSSSEIDGGEIRPVDKASVGAKARGSGHNAGVQIGSVLPSARDLAERNKSSQMSSLVPTIGGIVVSF